MPACVKDLHFQRLVLLDLQTVRFTIPGNLLNLLYNSEGLRKLRFCFVDLKRLDWWNNILLTI